MTTPSEPIIAQSENITQLSGIPCIYTEFKCNCEYAAANSIGGTQSGHMFVGAFRPVKKPNIEKNIVLLHGDYFTSQVSLLFPSV